MKAECRTIAPGTARIWFYRDPNPYETLATPLTYLVVAQLKRAESVDAYDTTTNFNPFAVAQITAQEKLSS